MQNVESPQGEVEQLTAAVLSAEKSKFHSDPEIQDMIENARTVLNFVQCPEYSGVERRKSPRDPAELVNGIRDMTYRMLRALSTKKGRLYPVEQAA